ncbi:MAG TPA: Uma2 family endonuclease [Verrucomicrobiae bacterium]
MPAMTIELPSHAERTEFNLRRWAELLDDPVLARIEGRIETDRHGYIIMSPPPAPGHGSYQLAVGSLLGKLMPFGRALTECPISTADGVRAADVAWASPERMKSLGNRVCFPEAPEICVEILSPGNTVAEMKEKRQLYFEAGAKEVWLCGADGKMSFYHAGLASPQGSSKLCPEFPKKVELT